MTGILSLFVGVISSVAKLLQCCRKSVLPYRRTVTNSSKLTNNLKLASESVVIIPPFIKLLQGGAE